ncbi:MULTISPECIES: hypothetical protein [Pacificimonas]|nr:MULTISPECIES: hypothetical protein [Pacificimonas]
MNQTAFVIAAYVAAAIGIGGVLAWAYLTMRRAERRAEELRR